MTHRMPVIFFLLASSTAVHAGPKEDAQAAYSRFFTSFTTGNHDEVAALFAPDALFYGTGSAELVTKPAGVREYFVRALSGPAVVKATPLSNDALMLGEDVVVISGKWQSERTSDGKTITNGPLRNTVVMQQRAGRWYIVQFHNSLTPNPPAPVPAAAPVR